MVCVFHLYLYIVTLFIRLCFVGFCYSFVVDDVCSFTKSTRWKICVFCVHSFFAFLHSFECTFQQWLTNWLNKTTRFIRISNLNHSIWRQETILHKNEINFICIQNILWQEELASDYIYLTIRVCGFCYHKRASDFSGREKCPKRGCKMKND